MAIYAVIDANGNVTNMVEWDGESEWSPGNGFTAVPVTANAAIGGTYANGTFTLPPQPSTTVTT
jgi:hypothetical protein